MARIRVKLGFPSRSKKVEEERTVEVTNLSEVLRLVRDAYPLDYYTFLMFRNGVRVEDEDEVLGDGDEVTVIPVFSGG